MENTQTNKEKVCPLSETFSKDVFSEQKINTLKYYFVFTPPFIAKPKVKT